MLDRHRNPNGTYDGAGVMADLTGLSRQSVVELAEQVKANSERLAGCPYHEFAPIASPAGHAQPAPRQRYRCIECGGEVSRTEWYWHEQGRRSAPVPEAPW